MSTPLAHDVTVGDVLATLAKPESYLRHVLANLYECKRQHGNAVIRIGTTGGGIAPNYRLEFSTLNSFIGVGIEGVFDGRSHKKIQWIDEIAQEDGVPVKDEHWSARTMTLDEVAVLLGQVRAAKKGRIRQGK